jgi:RNA polymerase sigma factor for flagellar operon FliA
VQPLNPTAERDRLITEHLPLVRAIAVRVFDSLPVHVDLDDLVHAGTMGLFDAVLKYDDNNQVTFQGYAKHRIRGAILDSIRDMDWASRDLRKRHKRLEDITREALATLGRVLTESEIAEKMDTDVKRRRPVGVDLRAAGLFLVSSRVPEDENRNTPAFPTASEMNQDKLAGKRQLGTVAEVHHGDAAGAIPDRSADVPREPPDDAQIAAVLGINE